MAESFYLAGKMPGAGVRGRLAVGSYDVELFVGEDVRVYAESGSRESRVVVVSFSQTAAEVTGNEDTPDDGNTTEQTFGAKQLKALAVDRVFVVASWRHGWQTPEMSLALDVIRAHIATIGPHAVIVAGVSLGGYGALIFAQALGASGVLAFAPQASVDSRKLHWDQRSELPGFARIARRIAGFRGDDGRLPFDDMTGTLQSPIPKFILYDALTPDRLHAERINGANVMHLPVFHTGHLVTRYLRQTGMLQALMEAVLLGDADGVVACVAQARRNRRRSADFRSALATALQDSERHLLLSKHVLKGLVAQYPRQIALRHALVNILRRLGRTAAALTEARAILDMRPGDKQAAVMVDRLQKHRARGRRLR